MLETSIFSFSNNVFKSLSYWGSSKIGIVWELILYQGMKSLNAVNGHTKGQHCSEYNAAPEKKPEKEAFILKTSWKNEKIYADHQHFFLFLLFIPHHWFIHVTIVERMDGQQCNEFCPNNYHQSSERILAEPEVRSTMQAPRALSSTFILNVGAY